MYKEVIGEKYVPDRAAEKLENLVGLHPSKEQYQTLAQANHWAVGIGAISAIVIFISMAVAGNKVVGGIGIAGLIGAGILNLWLQMRKEP